MVRLRRSSEPSFMSIPGVNACQTPRCQGARARGLQESIDMLIFSYHQSRIADATQRPVRNSQLSGQLARPFHPIAGALRRLEPSIVSAEVYRS